MRNTLSVSGSQRSLVDKLPDQHCKSTFFSDVQYHGADTMKVLKRPQHPGMEQLTEAP
jgi:hypothetical protein